jgi:hypothetical protein
MTTGCGDFEAATFGRCGQLETGVLVA